MKVLVLGPTGSIGGAVVAALRARNHSVVGLARSDASAQRLAQMEVPTIRGDIRQPAGWLGVVDDVEAVVSVAGDFTPDSELIERRLVDGLLGRLQLGRSLRTIVYTGGCWLFGETGDHVATEESAFDPLPAFAWSVDCVKSVLAATSVRGIVIHPAMVYERDGGVFAQFREDFETTGRIRVIGHDAVRWPLVHRDDLGVLYALALERGAAGTSYNGSAIESYPVGLIARAMARRFGAMETLLLRTPDEAAAELGEWARGYAMDQAMSGEKARRELGWSPVHTDPLDDVA